MNTISPILKFIVIPAIVLSLANTSFANTAEKSKLDGLKIGVNAVYNQAGFKNYDDKVVILPSAFYESERVYARANRLGYKLWKNDNNELSVVTQYNGVEFDPKNAKDNFHNLDERNSTFFVGASYLKKTPIGAFRGQVFTDTFGDSDGTLARLTYIAKYQKDKLSLYPSAGVQWQDKKYNDYYYGVSDKESAKTGIDKYQPKDNVHPYINVVGMYDMTDDWGLFFNQNIAYNTDEQYDSPKVDSRTKLSSAVGVTYKF